MNCKGLDGQLAVRAERDAGEQPDHRVGDRGDLLRAGRVAVPGGSGRLGEPLADAGGDLSGSSVLEVRIDHWAAPGTG